MWRQRHSCRDSLFAILCIGAALLMSAGARGNEQARRWVRDTLKATFPDIYERERQAFGWEMFDGVAWKSLPENVPRCGIVLIHGLDEPGKLWMNAAPAIAEEGYRVLRFSYPNDQPVRQSAAFLLASLESLRLAGARDLVIVSHSMGGLVTRDMLTSPNLEYTAWREKDRVPRIRGVIMLGTPNHGAPLATLRVFAEIKEQWTRFVRGEGRMLGGFTDGCGEAGIDLRPDSPFLRELNARPLPADIPMTIVAGIVSPLSGDAWRTHFNGWRKQSPAAMDKPLTDLQEQLESLTADVGDGAVPLASTRLDGVTDHVIVQANHVSMIRNVRETSDRLPPALPIVLDRIRGWCDISESRPLR